MDHIYFGFETIEGVTVLQRALEDRKLACVNKHNIKPQSTYSRGTEQSYITIISTNDEEEIIMSSNFTLDENKVITIRTNSFNAVKTFLGSNITEKIDIMYNELTKMIPNEKAIKITEIRNVTTAAEITNKASNTDYN